MMRKTVAGFVFAALRVFLTWLGMTPNVDAALIAIGVVAIGALSIVAYWSLVTLFTKERD
jgi:hypothetical protein